MAIEEEIARAIGENFQACRGRNGVSRTELAAALMPLLNRVRAESAVQALREAAESSQAKMFSPAVYVGPRRLKLAVSAKEWLNERATEIEQNGEGNET